MLDNFLQLNEIRQGPIIISPEKPIFLNPHLQICEKHMCEIRNFYTSTKVNFFVSTGGLEIILQAFIASNVDY